MLYAIISDIHANMEALEVCFNEIDNIKPDRVICLGDIVDYCAEPNEATELIKQKCDTVILGNHDEAQFNYELPAKWTDNAFASSKHTRTVIKPEHIEYFRSLPDKLSENNFLFVHATPFVPRNYRYIRDADAAGINFNHFDEKICFIGHSHIPVIFENSDNEVKQVQPGILNRENKYIINVGSVGQPRDNDPRLSFGIFDTETYEYKNVRLSYDIKSAAQKIIKEGLPVYLADRLFEGI